MKTKRTIYRILEYVVVILLGGLLAINYSLFIVPNGFAPAGINGIAVMVQYKLGFSVGYMALLINIPLCIFAFFFVGRSFSIKTMMFCLTYSFAYLWLQKTQILRYFVYNAMDIDTIYPVMLSGLVTGFVNSVLFQNNACTGGTDVVSRFVSKKKPTIDFFWITFAFNAVVAVASYFVYAQVIDGHLVYQMKPVCLCLFYCYLSSLVGTSILKGSHSAREFVIVTEHPDEIEQTIIHQMHHTATRLDGIGSYSGKNKTVLLSIINNHQAAEFEQLVSCFQDTFVFEQPISRTLGNFKKIK